MKNKFLESIYPVVLSISCLFATSAYCQEIQYKLIDSGVLTHNVHGKGIELRIRPSEMPDGGLNSISQETLLYLCRYYAPSVVPFVSEKTGLTDAEFIAVRVVSGNTTFGRYVLQIYALEDDTCSVERN